MTVRGSEPTPSDSPVFRNEDRILDAAGEVMRVIPRNSNSAGFGWDPKNGRSFSTRTRERYDDEGRLLERTTVEQYDYTPPVVREGPGCDVYWGSHGCRFDQGHEGACECDCCGCENHPDHDSGCVAAPPYYGPQTMFYGDDVELRGLPRQEEAAE